MQSVHPIVLALSLAACGALLPLTGCEKKSEHAAPAAKATPGAKAEPHDHDHDHDDGHAHDNDDDHGHDHDHGPKTDLGEQSVSGFTVKATRSGEIRPGADATFDISVEGGTSKPAAIRLWVGTPDGRGSIKARGEAEDHGWHAHVEVPETLPADPRLWVEIETTQGEKVLAGFDLQI